MAVVEPIPADFGRPFVNLGGGGWPDHVYAGGRVCGIGDEPAHVALHSANGVTLSDDPIDRTVLFIAPQGQRIDPPIHVELRSASGALLAQQNFIE